MTPLRRDGQADAPRGDSPRGPVDASTSRERFVDQLLAVGHFLGELGVRALLARNLEPRVVFGVGERDDLDAVVA